MKSPSTTMKSNRWTYSTTLATHGNSMLWHTVGTTFDKLDDAAKAATEWLILSAQHNHFVAVKLEKIDEI